MRVFASWRVWCVLVVCGLQVLFLAVSCSSPTPPVLDAIRPAIGFHRGATQVRILGRSLSADAQLVLVGANQERVTLQEVRALSDGELQAVVPAKSPAARYDLHLLREGSEPIVLGGAFEVMPDALAIYAVNVGQGDATLLVSPLGKTMLIDAGREDEVTPLRELLQELGFAQVDHILSSHYDADHVGGIASIIAGKDGKLGTDDDRPPREALWDYGGWSKSQSYADARNHYKDRHRPLDGKTKDSFVTIDLGGGVTVEVRTTNGVIRKADGTLETVSCGSDTNCRSIGTMVKYGAFQMWTAGDLTGGGNSTPDVETRLAPHLPKVHVYRAHHHGSKTSSNDALLGALQPQVVLISAGMDNSYCHPHAEIIDRFVKLSAVSVLLTTAGIASSTKCGKSTEQRLSALGNRGVVDGGHLRLIVEETKYRVTAMGRSQTMQFDLQR